MKKIIASLAALALAGAALADTGATTVTVTAESFDSLTVPTSAGITLGAPSGAGATAYGQGTLAQAGSVDFSHNQSGTMKISAIAVADALNDPNDITLGVALGGQTAKNLVAGGTVATAQDLYTAVTAGGYTWDLAWTADASLASTPADSYIYTVTFTSTAE